jgi:hypothetical protein
MMPNSSQIYNKKIIGAGLAVFVVLVTFPFWYNLGKAAPAPELELTEKAKSEKQCIRSKSYMKAEHMQVLDIWRDTVTRDAKRTYVGSNGKVFTMSLTNTCLDCHSNKAAFCDRCHNYASVSPYCWDCHVIPEEKK